ncbi:AbrB/MazE/SpoVT family DNA-binding domain-containing protein [Bradyrhizobium amphicarpaeae]|nr:AbrB/MazE/SpoVT family DNA-binding domain-containing protein [Bradyrhizobium amphicarpaeae]
MKVFKWNDDLGVVLTQELIDKLGLKEGDDIEITLFGGSGIAVETMDCDDRPRGNPPR